MEAEGELLARTEVKHRKASGVGKLAHGNEAQ